ncbi:hypothetical protein B6U82_00450 [Candidatus Pacearchaeota archaeon ex4484_31]|nr:MAG: hypothetical protein B6U82_00450 [Candidatus Pacearchaeota archaeon ex4484_31]
MKAKEKLTKDQKDRIFQVELERFRMFERWERTLFYWLIATLVSIIYLSLQGVNVLKVRVTEWLFILSILLIIGELIINRFLNIKKDDLIEKIKKDSW